MWDYTNVISSNKGKHVVDKSEDLDLIPEWFKESRLNFAENLLWCRRSDKTAIVATGKWGFFFGCFCSADIFLGEGHGKRFISYEELYNDVLKFAEALKSLGVKKGDRVAAYIPNCAEAIIAMLATTSLGALWRYVACLCVCVCICLGN